MGYTPTQSLLREQVIRCPLKATAWDQDTFGVHCFRTKLAHCSTKLRCTYQFKSPMETIHRFVAIKLWTPTCLSHGLLFSPSQYCSMLREPMWISAFVSTFAPANFPLRRDRQEKWPTLDFLKVRFRGSLVRRSPHDSGGHSRCIRRRLVASL